MLKICLHSRVFALLLTLGLLVSTYALSGCGRGSSAAPPPSIASVTVSPSTVTIAGGQSQQFFAHVNGTGNFDSTVKWSLGGSSGASTLGSISDTGIYVSPANLTSPITITVTATSNADTSKAGSSEVNIVPGLISSVTLNANNQNVIAGSNVSLLAQVSGTGNYNSLVKWTVDDIVGGNSIFGTIGSGLAVTYTAPDAVPDPQTVTVKAISVQDPTKFAAIQLTVVAPPLGIISVSLSPAAIDMPDDQSFQFTPTVVGVGQFDSSLTWTVVPVAGSNVPVGSVTPSGLFTPPLNLPSATTFNVTATSVADPSKSATCQVTVHPPPVITQLLPSSGNVGDVLQISGKNLDGLVAAQFSGPNRIPIQYVQYGGNDVGSSTAVPYLAMTGNFSVISQWKGFRPVSSNTLQFTRLPHLRIRAAHRDLSSGESTQFYYRILGQPDTRQVTWSTDLGSINSSGTFVAPTVVADSFTHVTGCISGTQICQSEVLGLHPLRIVPYPAAVPINGSLQLETIVGGVPTGAIWTQLAGGGSLSASGLFTAGNDLSGSGGIPVTAQVGPSSASGVIAVTGAVPGAVSEISDYIDLGQNSSLGTYNLQVASAGNRLFVLANYGGYLDQSYFWIDVYDMSDPVHPVWVDAFESAANSRLRTYQGFLYQILPADESEGALNPGIIAIFDTSGGTSHLVARQLTSTLVSPPAQPAYANGIFAVISDYSYADNTILISQYDLRSGSIQRADFTLPLPAGASSLTGFIAYPVATDSRLFLFNYPSSGINPPSAYNLDTYDITKSPPVLLQRQSTPYSAGLITGSYLVSGNILLDISSGLPVELSAIPLPLSLFSGPDLLFNGKQLLLGGGQSGYRIEDISDPLHPFPSAVLFDGFGLGNNAAWVGQYGVTAGGGLRIYDLATVGGGFVKPAPLGPYAAATTYDELVYENRLFTATYAPNNLTSSTFIAAIDLNVDPLTKLGQFGIGTETPLALQARGSTLYVGTNQNLLLLDISNPQNMSQTSSVAGGINCLAISGQYLFAGMASNQLVVYDVSQPSSPSALITVPLPAAPDHLRISGNNLFVADDVAGLLIYNIAQPAHPLLLSQFQVSSAVGDVAVDGDLAVLATYDRGLVIASVSNPASPNIVSQAVIPSYTGGNSSSPATTLVLTGKIAYVGTLFDGANVYGFDYQTPSHPRLVSVMPLGGPVCDNYIYAFAQSSSNLFVGGRLDGLQGNTAFDVIDITQPRNVINWFPDFYAFNPNPQGNPTQACTNSTPGAPGVHANSVPSKLMKYSSAWQKRPAARIAPAKPN